MTDSICQHRASYCVQSYETPEYAIKVANSNKRIARKQHFVTDQTCPTNCRHPNCPLANPALCEHPRSKCPNVKCPSNCPNIYCPGMDLRGGIEYTFEPPSIWSFTRFTEMILCLAAFGLPRPDLIWQKMETDWDGAKTNVVDRLNNASLVAGLLLASTGAFLTTTPPPTPGTAKPLLDYTSFAPYTLLVLSYATSLGSLIAVAGLQFVARSCEQRWFRRVVAGKYYRLYFTMFMLAYPYLSLGLSTIVCAMGLIVSAWPSGNLLFRIGSILVIFIPSLLVPIVVLLWHKSNRSRPNGTQGQV